MQFTPPPPLWKWGGLEGIKGPKGPFFLKKKIAAGLFGPLVGSCPCMSSSLSRVWVLGDAVLDLVVAEALMIVVMSVATEAVLTAHDSGCTEKHMLSVTCGVFCLVLLVKNQNTMDCDTCGSSFLD